jgi:putative spermidine/putrescine transport system ATP-binding protein
VTATMVADLPIDSPVVLSIRPERVIIGDAGSGSNRFDAQLEEVIYLGDHCKLRLRLGGSDAFVARIANTAAASRMRRGDAVVASWRPESCLALPPATGG